MAAGVPAAADGNSSASAHSGHSLLPMLMREPRASSLASDGGDRSGASGSGPTKDAMAADASKAAAVWDTRTAGQASRGAQSRWPA